MSYENLVAVGPMGWIAMLSAAIIGAVAVIGMVNESYKDTTLQFVGLMITALASVAIILQLLTNAQISDSACTLFILGVAEYGVATVLKHRRFNRKVAT